MLHVACLAPCFNTNRCAVLCDDMAQGMEVINDPDVEAVWICSPSQFHADQIKASAKAGKHIFCEKPIATDLAGTIEAVQVCCDGDDKHTGIEFVKAATSPPSCCTCGVRVREEQRIKRDIR